MMNDLSALTRPVGWDGLHLSQLLTLAPVGEGHWRSQAGDTNANGRSYGGQLLGQAAMAGLLSLPEGRQPTVMQCLFLQGADPCSPIDWTTQILQEGKRFSSRHVRGHQGGRQVFDAQLSAALPMDGPAHEDAPCTAPAGERPEDLPALNDLPRDWFTAIRRLSGYEQAPKPCIDCRVPAAHAQLHSAAPHFRYWMRLTHPLPDDARMRMAAFAFLSDWWLNFSSLAPHLRHAVAHPMYLASLNHAIWIHRPVEPGDWLHVASGGPATGHGRGLSLAHVHDRAGRLVATLSQQSLIIPAD